METLMESLIEAVKGQPSLWDPLHCDYRDVVKKDLAWEKVVEVIKHKSISNVKVAKIEWRRLRDNHRDALKRAKLGKNKLLPAQITTWKYAKSMQFLEPYMKYRITENIEMESDKSKGNTSSDHDVSTTGASDTGTENLSHPIPHKRQKQETTPLVYLSPKDKQKVQAANALDSFFNCMHQSTREMPLWMQTNVKKKIFAVVIEAEEQLSSQRQDEDEYSDCINEVHIKSENLSDDPFSV